MASSGAMTHMVKQQCDSTTPKLTFISLLSLMHWTDSILTFISSPPFPHLLLTPNYNCKQKMVTLGNVLATLKNNLPR